MARPIPPPDVSVLNAQSPKPGLMAQDWYLYFVERLAADNATAAAAVAAALAAAAAAKPLLIAQDEKASTVVSGTFTTGAFRTRDLNTVKLNQITGASVASNQVTLPIGSYVFRWRAPAFSVDRHQSKLFNVTDAADVAAGTNEFAGSTGVQATASCGEAYFTIAGIKVLEIRHQCQTTAATNGFGLGDVTYAATNVYTQISVAKVA